MKNKMITVTIEGPKGSGKTRIRYVIEEWCSDHDMNYILEVENVRWPVGLCTDYDKTVLIIEK